MEMKIFNCEDGSQSDSLNSYISFYCLFIYLYPL